MEFRFSSDVELDIHLEESQAPSTPTLMPSQSQLVENGSFLISFAVCLLGVVQVTGAVWFKFAPFTKLCVYMRVNKVRLELPRLFNPYKIIHRNSEEPTSSKTFTHSNPMGLGYKLLHTYYVVGGAQHMQNTHRVHVPVPAETPLSIELNARLESKRLLLGTCIP